MREIAEGRPVLSYPVDQVAGEDVRKWVSWSDDSERVLLVAVRGSDGGPDVGRFLSPDEARSLGMALIGAAALTTKEFRGTVKGGKP